MNTDEIPYSCREEIMTQRYEQPARCKYCGANIFWATTINGKKMPLDAAASAEGNVDATVREAVVVVGAEEAAFLRSNKILLYTCHIATCTKYRKK